MSYWRRLRIRKNNYKVPKRLSKGPAVTKAAISLHDLQPLVFSDFIVLMTWKHCCEHREVWRYNPSWKKLNLNKSFASRWDASILVDSSSRRLFFRRIMFSTNFFDAMSSWHFCLLFCFVCFLWLSRCFTKPTLIMGVRNIGASLSWVEEGPKFSE